MLITAQLLSTCLNKCTSPHEWATALDTACSQFAINTDDRLAAFLAQTGYESGHFNITMESLNYKTLARLRDVFKARLPMSDAAASQYLNAPEKLANLVYANRLGNGPESSGDGFRFRGRGIIQLTGRSNYREAGTAIGVALETTPDLAAEKDVAAQVAAWFWSSRGLNALADDKTGDDDLEDFKRITRIINGGLLGLTQRFELYQTIRAKL